MSTNAAHLADNIVPVTRGSVLVVDLSGGLEVIVDLEDQTNRPAAPLAGSGETADAKRFWSGMYATMQADGGDLLFYFTSDGVGGLVNAPVGGLGVRQGAKIHDGESVDQLLPVAPQPGSQGGAAPPVWQRRYLHLIQAAGSAGVFCTIWPSSTKAM